VGFGAVNIATMMRDGHSGFQMLQEARFFSWPKSRHRLSESKGGRCVGLTTSLPSCSGSSSPLCFCTSKGGGICLKTQLSWFCILLSNVTTCFGLAWPSSGRNVVNKGENTHNRLYTGVM
jgi:hypothetical protein